MLPNIHTDVARPNWEKTGRKRRTVKPFFRFLVPFFPLIFLFIKIKEGTRFSMKYQTHSSQVITFVGLQSSLQPVPTPQRQAWTRWWITLRKPFLENLYFLFSHCRSQLEARNDELEEPLGIILTSWGPHVSKHETRSHFICLSPSCPPFSPSLASSLRLLPRMIGLHFAAHQPPCNDYV